MSAPSRSGTARRPEVRRLLIHAVLAGTTALLILPQLGRGLMLYDLGELLYFTDAFTDRLAPGADYQVNAYGPGRYLLLSGLFGLFSRSFDVIWGLFLVLRLGITALLWQVGRRYLPTHWAILPVVCLWVAPGPLHKGFYLLGSLALMWGFLRYLDRPGRRRAAAFGLLLAAVALFRLDLGLFGALLFTFGALGQRRVADLAVAAAPTALGLLGFAIVLAGEGVLGTVIGQLLSDAFTNQTISTPSFPGPSSLASGNGDAWFLWLPLVVYGGLALLLVRAEALLGRGSTSEERRRLGALLVLGLLTLNQVRMKPEFGHLLQAGPLLWLAAAVLLAWMTRRTWPGWGAVALGLGLLLPTLLVLHTVQAHRGDVYTGSFTIPEERRTSLDTQLGRVWLNEGEHAELAPTLAWLGQQPPGALWVPTNQPLLYGLTGRDDATGFVGVLYYAGDRADQNQLIQRLETRRPPVAVFVNDTVEGPERLIGVAAPRVHSYLLTHYDEVGRAGRMRWMRRSD